MILDDTRWPLRDEEYLPMLLEFLAEAGSFRVSAESEPFEVTKKCTYGTCPTLLATTVRDDYHTILIHVNISDY